MGRNACCKNILILQSVAGAPEVGKTFPARITPTPATAPSISVHVSCSTSLEHNASLLAEQACIVSVTPPGRISVLRAMRLMVLKTQRTEVLSHQTLVPARCQDADRQEPAEKIFPRTKQSAFIALSLTNCPPVPPVQRTRRLRREPHTF